MFFLHNVWFVLTVGWEVIAKGGAGQRMLLKVVELAQREGLLRVGLPRLVYSAVFQPFQCIAMFEAHLPSLHSGILNRIDLDLIHLHLKTWGQHFNIPE